jgi:hypothetical protein
MTQAFEAAQINESQKRIARDYQEDQKRAEIDRMFAEYIDAVESGSVTDAEFLEVHKQYINVDTTIETRNVLENNTSQQIDSGVNFLAQLADSQVEALTEGCPGILEVSILGFHKNFCRSHLPRSIAMRPAPPMQG